MLPQALWVAALADGSSRLSGVRLDDRTREIIDLLSSLGVPIRADEAGDTLDITGTGGYWPNDEVELRVKRSAETLYLLTAACCLGHGPYRIEAAGALASEPVSVLVRGLADLGAGIGYADQVGYPPLTIRASRLRGGTTVLPASALLLNAVLLVAPYAQTDVFIELPSAGTDETRLASTLSAMEAFGVQAINDAARRLIIPAPQRYRAADLVQR